MCGIAGVVRFDGAPLAPGVANEMLARLRHRGPDDRGRHDVAGAAGAAAVSLLHTRLAIIDPAAGVQPVLAPDGKSALVFNGEIYNFKELREELRAGGFVFRTDGDAEVVLAAYLAWGRACVSRLCGMFAFAIYDAARRELFLARDRLGIKPLVYFQNDRVCVFASELRALLAHPDVPRALDVDALDDFLHFQYVPSPWTIYRDVRKLDPGHTLVVDAASGAIERARYWAPRFEPDHERSDDDWLDETDACVRRVVRDHLVSDVPFGAFLSGGLDSGLVAACMRDELGDELRTFTIGFSDAQADEGAQAAATARFLGSRHRTTRLDAPSLEDVDRLLSAYGEPFADSSALPTFAVARLAANAGVKMVLSGDGGDELFGGYLTYQQLLRAERRSWRTCFRVPTDRHRLRRHSRAYAYFNDRPRRKLTVRPLPRERADFRDALFAASRGAEPLSRYQHLDLLTYLPGDILTKVDIASMQCSLEVRVPLLDHRLVELAGRIPARLKMRLDRIGRDGRVEGKVLLRRCAQRHLTAELIDRPKRGFGIPLGDWLAGPWLDGVRDRLASLGSGGAPSGVGDLLDRRRVAAYVSDPATVRAHAVEVWALLALSAWDRAAPQRTGA